MIVWTNTFILLTFVLFFLWKIRKNDKVKKLPVNARWLFGIFSFLSAYDVWMSFFMVFWLGIVAESDPLFGAELSLPLLIFTKIGLILFIYLSLKYLSIKMSPEEFCATSIFISFICCLASSFVAIFDECQLYKALYYFVANNGQF